jgi:putative protein kinase ArgK-like GTPase of G3E family
MGYTEQRNLIDKLICTLNEERRKFYTDKLAKMDKRTGGAHRAGITGLLSMLKTETNNEGK